MLLLDKGLPLLKVAEKEEATVVAMGGQAAHRPARQHQQRTTSSPHPVAGDAETAPAGAAVTDSVCRKCDSTADLASCTY